MPYDYARPRGKTFRLKLVRLPAADPAHRIGSLFINFRGPGAPAAVTVRQIGKFLLPPQVLARYDLVGIDPRGTGQSQPVRCTASTREQLSFPSGAAAKFPLTPAEQAEAIRQVRRYPTQCRTRNGAQLDHTGTLPFARDLDVRAALGDRQINHYGRSYGAFPRPGPRQHLPHPHRGAPPRRGRRPGLGQRASRQHQLAPGERRRGQLAHPAPVLPAPTPALVTAPSPPAATRNTSTPSSPRGYGPTR